MSSRSKVIDDSFILHRLVFQDDVQDLGTVLSSKVHDINNKDTHGNTPLHLAAMLGHLDCLNLLLSHEAKVAIKNSQGWTPLAEAVSFGDRRMIKSLLMHQRKQTRDELSRRRPELIKGLESMGNFYMELRWDFQSWIPLVSRILPSDVCKIYKKGADIRLDTTLVDFNDMRWERGDISFLFKAKGCRYPLRRKCDDGEPSKESPSSSRQTLIVMDNKLKVFQRIRHQESEHEMDDEVDILMSSDIVAAQLSTKALQFHRLSSGWLFRSEKTESVGSFMADYYSVTGFAVESRKRREHLTEEDLQKNKAIIDNLTRGPSPNGSHLDMGSKGDQSLLQPIRRSSLPPPTKARKITWMEYISSPPGQFPALGRSVLSKSSSKSFRATLAMSQDFPLTVDSLINVLEVIAPLKQFKKMREFVEVRLPPGFPVKIEIPILPTVTAKITFQDFVFDDQLPDELFSIPPSYTEDPSRFPDL